MTIGENLKQQVLFTRENFDSISQRCTTYIMQRNMDPGDAWKQAIEDEAALIEATLELMEEGALTWDWPSMQLLAMRIGLELFPKSENQQTIDSEAVKS
jgi:hypothetical protein